MLSHCHDLSCHAHQLPLSDAAMFGAIAAALLILAIAGMFAAAPAIKRAIFRFRLRRAINTYAHNCPTGRAFYAALGQAERDNRAWLKANRKR